MVNWREEDRVALLPHCGEDHVDGVGFFSQVAEAARGSSSSILFRWADPLKLSAAQMQEGLELCWKAVKDMGQPRDSVTAYSAKFGTVLIAGEEISHQYFHYCSPANIWSYRCAVASQTELVYCEYKLLLRHIS